MGGGCGQGIPIHPQTVVPPSALDAPAGVVYLSKDHAPGNAAAGTRVVGHPVLGAAEQDIAILTYNKEGVVTEHPEDEWAAREGFTCHLPMIKVEDLAAYVDYPICKMLITLDPARRDEVCAEGKKRFEGQIDLYPSSPFFIEAVPLGVAKDVSLGALLEKMGLTRENLMACGDGLNDRSMLAFAGTGVAMRNAEDAVKAVASDVTTADNNHDGVAEAIEKFILD